MAAPKNQSSIEAMLKESEQRYQAFIHNSLEGIWRFELEEPVPVTLPVNKQIDLVFEQAYLAEANDAMARMYGMRKAEQLVGTRLTQLMDRSVTQNTEYLTAFIASGYNLHGVESEETDANGNTKYFLNSLVGIIEDGKIQRAWGTQLDVTSQHAVTAALQRSQERLELAIKVSRVGLWEWDVTAGELTWSDELRKIYNVGKRMHIDYANYISRIHTDDLAEMQQTIQQSMQTGAPYESEHRIVWPNGEVHWVYSRGQAFLQDGKPVRMTGTCLNIDERKAAEELKVRNALLNAERTELVRLNKSKDEFIALASHQLRTPATSVKQYLGMLLEGFAGDLKLTDQQLKLLQTAYDSNQRQIEIINDLLLIATIDAGKITLQKKPTDIAEFLGEIVEENRPKYNAKNQNIRLVRPDKPIVVTCDDIRLHMAIENLLDNAWKYSPDGAMTTITLKVTPKAVRICVTDQGVGIDKADFKKLFQKFSRIPNPLSTSSGGSGLGLYWAHNIIKLHGGSLSVKSERDKGTTFIISLPVSTEF